MPELPEVETMRRILEPLLVGRAIRRVRVHRDDIIGFPADARRFAARAKGRRIVGLRRTGKYLVIRLSGDAELVVHMRLSGHLEVVGPRTVPRYERLRFELTGGKALSFAEPRVLGKAYLVEAGSRPAVLKGMREMGPEPVEPGFTIEWLSGMLRGRKASVKSLLLDQRVCCGVGNIYSDEALFRAGIRPQRAAGSLTAAEVARLARALRSVLKDGIRWCGTTMRDRRYVLPDGAAGGFQKRLRVFGLTGEMCRDCGGKIRRGRVGNRSTHYCPACQR